MCTGGGRPKVGDEGGGEWKQEEDETKKKEAEDKDEEDGFGMEEKGRFRWIPYKV